MHIWHHTSGVLPETGSLNFEDALASSSLFMLYLHVSKTAEHSLSRNHGKQWERLTLVTFKVTIWKIFNMIFPRTSSLWDIKSTNNIHRPRDYGKNVEWIFFLTLWQYRALRKCYLAIYRPLFFWKLMLERKSHSEMFKSWNSLSNIIQ